MGGDCAMKYYIDESKVIYALEDGLNPEELLPVKVKDISEKEALLIANPPPTKEQLIADAELQKQSLLSEATSIIDPLNDAVDLGMSTPEEEVLLKEWKKYRVLLNRVDTSIAPDITWPVKP
ncbi:tail fiber assembly protein [Morganella morganii subsp. morganii]|nr:tail fiber assembly protein [Morganella morganii]MBS9584239.1 tail fiber assembly protein [Morganella morganii subsp. morganii]EKW5730574.1 tail fiber assembly protein [Morganella morganii]MBT0504987.1 tail fiber assembly protein [Morganella morganii subsp. morganii]QWL86659.1 tail fiber assembly protein [Morganella morganii subsp. morganii]